MYTTIQHNITAHSKFSTTHRKHLSSIAPFICFVVDKLHVEISYWVYFSQ